MPGRSKGDHRLVVVTTDESLQRAADYGGRRGLDLRAEYDTPVDVLLLVIPTPDSSVDELSTEPSAEEPNQRSETGMTCG